MLAGLDLGLVRRGAPDNILSSVDLSSGDAKVATTLIDLAQR